MKLVVLITFLALQFMSLAKAGSLSFISQMVSHSDHHDHDVADHSEAEHHSHDGESHDLATQLPHDHTHSHGPGQPEHTHHHTPGSGVGLFVTATFIVPASHQETKKALYAERPLAAIPSPYLDSVFRPPIA